MGFLVERFSPSNPSPRKGCVSKPTLEMFREDDPPCYEPQTAVVDTHVRFRPFGGVAIPSEETVSGFMEVLRERGIPLAIHADLGNDEEPARYLPLIQEMLRLYPANTIVWMHMGLSRELVDMDTLQHTSTMAALLDRYPQSDAGYLLARD